MSVTSFGDLSIRNAAVRPLVRLREKKRLRDPGFDAVLIARGRQALYESIRVGTRTATTFDPRAIVHNLQLLTGS